MIKIGICDDNENFLEIVTYKIKKSLEKDFNIDYEIHTFSSLESFNEYYKKDSLDIVFLDVMVGSVNAMDWSIDKFKNDNIQLIFMTAYPQCAYNISEANCCYYLIKSRIDDTTLKKAFTHAFENISNINNSYLTIKSNNGYNTVKVDDIIYIESLSNNIIFHINNKNIIESYSSLKTMQEKLPISFLRCHHSYIVNMNHIVRYCPYCFILDSNNEVPIPVKKYKEVIKEYKDFLNNFKGEL